MSYHDHFGRMPGAVRLHRRAALLSSVARVATSITVTPSAPSVGIGGTVQLTAKVFDQFGSQMPGEVVAWSSGTPADATVDAGTGLVTGVAAGSSTITATSGAAAGSVDVTVHAASVATTVDVTPNVFDVGIGGTQQLTATVRDQFGDVMAGAPVSWTSDTPAVASVNISGLVSGVAGGSATITATSGSASGAATADVTTGTDFHVATTGAPGNAGTAASPWDYVTGLAGGPTGTEAGGDDRVLIHAGEYGTGVETVTVSASGTPGHPLLIMPAPGEMFAINVKQLDKTGHDVRLWNEEGFYAELYCGLATPDGTDLLRMQEAGDGAKVVHWVVHDGGGIGIAPQSETADHEAGGNYVWNNGRSLTLSPTFGHGIYAHGTTTVGQKRKIRGNIVFNQAAYGVHTFADTGNEKNLQVHWNFAFGNGVATDGGGGHVGYDFLIGGQTALTDCDVQHNCTVNPRGSLTASVGYLADGDPGAVGSGGIHSRNYYAGGLNLGNWDNAGFTNTYNTVVGGDDGLLVRWKFQAATIQMAGNVSDFNTYASTQAQGYFAASYGGVAQDVIATYATLAALRAALGAGQEVHSTLTNAADLGTRIETWVSEYVARRAHVFIHNPSGAASVTVPAADFASMVASGEDYEVWDVNDLKTFTNPGGTPVLTGTADGGSVDFPMNAKTPKPLIGNAFPVADSHPTVACFVVLQTTVGGTPAITPASNTLTFTTATAGVDPIAQTDALTSSPAALGLSIDIAYGVGAGWLTATLDQGQTNAVLTAAVATAGLANGDYTATITIHSDNAPDVTIDVTLTVGAAGGDPAGIDTFQTALGGAAHLVASYDKRANWSDTAITDCRSGGTGPALSPTGAPVLDGNGNLVLDAGEDMHSALSALFALTSPGTLFLVAAITADGVNAAGVAPSAGAAVLIIAEGSGGKIGLWTDHDTLSTVAESATLRPIIITWDGVNHATIQVGSNAPIATTTGGDFDAGNAALTLGGFFPNSGVNGGCVIAAAHVADHVADSTEATAFLTYANDEFGAT